MSKYKTNTSKEVVLEAEKLARANQRPGQTKEQTKLVALGIQKGIEQYKKKNKVKSRELDKKLKKVKSKEDDLGHPSKPENVDSKADNLASAKLPWALLVLSWLSFVAYFVLNNI